MNSWTAIVEQAARTVARGRITERIVERWGRGENDIVVCWVHHRNWVRVVVCEGPRWSAHTIDDADLSSVRETLYELAASRMLYNASACLPSPLGACCGPA
jgi:hypothetical protein